MRTTYLKLADFQQDLNAARQATNTEPTPAQQEAGNYRKGRITVRGYLVAIENPKGSIRSGTSKSGKKWSTTMAHDYGYIVGSKAVDGDAVDLFLGPDPEKGGIYAVDQVIDGQFDEVKLCWGFKDETEARQAYLSNYEKGWKGLGDITPVLEDDLREWLDTGASAKGSYKAYKSRTSLHTRVSGVAADEGKMRESEKQAVSGLRRQGHQGMPPLGKFLSSILERHERPSPTGGNGGESRCKRELYSRELHLDSWKRAKQESPQRKVLHLPGCYQKIARMVSGAAHPSAFADFAHDQLQMGLYKGGGNSGRGAFCSRQMAGLRGGEVGAKRISQALRNTPTHTKNAFVSGMGTGKSAVDSRHIPAGRFIHRKKSEEDTVYLKLATAIDPQVTRALAKSLDKQAAVKQDPDTGKWILRTKDGKRKLGVHATAEAAYKQEYAILKSQEKSASGNPTMARSLAVGTLGSLPGAGLGMLAALGLSKFTGGSINPEVQRIVQSLLMATGGAVGGATARELDGQFDADQWDRHGNKRKRKHHDPLTRTLRVAERGAGVPLPELKAAATLGGLLNRCAFYKQASPRWAFQLAKGLLSPKAVKQLSTTAIGSTRRLPGLAPLGAGSEGVAHAAFTPGQGETVVKQFFSNPIGLDLTTRANVMKAHPTLFPKIHAVDQAGGRLVMDRLKPVTDAVSPKDLGSLGGSFSSAGGVNSGGVWQLSGRGIPGAPKRVSVRDVRAANVGHDSKGDLKVLDPIVDYGNPTKWEWQKYNWGNRVKALNPWQKPAPTPPAAPQRPWLDHLNQGGQTRIIRKPHPFAP